MQIELKDLSKRFNRELIFKNLNYTFKDSSSYAITGPNGSGKSTLLQIISSFNLPSSGQITYCHNEVFIEPEDIFREVSIAAPYLDIIQEFTLLEMLQFHFKFKKIRKGETILSIIEKSYFIGQEHKFIKNFSSGMKQRLKLAIAFFSESPILLLDEPTNNLDQQGIEWYQNKVSGINDRLVIIASNQKYEYQQCENVLNVKDFI
jgi:ABC-type multidrug transport system ATPase subunit